LNKKLFITLFIFISGFLVGSYLSGGPKGTELLVFVTLASIAGFATGAFLTKAIYKYKEWKQNPNVIFNIMGFKINIGADLPKETKRLELVKEESISKSKAKDKPVKLKCELCNGEPVTISGQKIKCPKCKGKEALAN
jgi:hypothetical protein